MISKYTSILTRRHFPKIATLLISASTVGAAELADLAGSWSLNALETPARLRETFYKPELTDANEVTTPATARDGFDANATALQYEFVVNVYFPDPFLVETSSFGIDANGSLSGSETGTITQINGNRLTFQNNEGVSTIYVNATGDILKQSKADANVQDLVIALKQPDSLAIPELAGTWSIATFTAPEDITVNKALVATRVQDFYVDYLRVVDTSFAGDFGIFNGTIEFDNLGEMTGDVTGTASTNGLGTVSVSTDGLVIPFAINALKNTMIATITQNGEVEYIVMVKKPTSVITSELAGSWRFTALEVPTQYSEAYVIEDPFQFRHADISQLPIGDEQWADISHTGAFRLDRVSIEVDESGSFSGLGGGTLTSNGTNGVNFLINGDTLNLNCNDDKTFLTGVIDDVNAQTLIVGIRVSGEPASTFEESVNLKISPAPEGAPLTLSWNGNSGLTLQTYNEAGEWGNVDLPDGTDSLTLDPAELGNTRLFRIAKGLNEEAEP